VQAGGAQADLARAQLDQHRAENAVRDLDAEHVRTRAMLNALMARTPDAPLEAPQAFPAPRPLPVDDAELLALAAERNPELAALAHDVAGRADAIELARLQYIPDFNPFVGIEGSAAQLVGIGVSIPTFLPEVAAMVKESKADLRKSRAMYRQASLERAAQIVAALYAVRNSERQVELFDTAVVPSAARIVESARTQYAAGSGTFEDLIEAQRVLLEAQLAIAEARAARETSLADLEALAGVDLVAQTQGDAGERIATAGAEAGRASR
jgi:outer membrane protein TolC